MCCYVSGKASVSLEPEGEEVVTASARLKVPLALSLARARDSMEDRSFNYPLEVRDTQMQDTLVIAKPRH